MKDIDNLTPARIVEELDKYIISQTSAKRSVAIALRNRWRRQQVQSDMRREIMPNNIIMIGLPEWERPRLPDALRAW